MRSHTPSQNPEPAFSKSGTFWGKPLREVAPGQPFYLDLISELAHAGQDVAGKGGRSSRSRRTYLGNSRVMALERRASRPAMGRRRSSASPTPLRRSTCKRSERWAWWRAPSPRKRLQSAVAVARVNCVPVPSQEFMNLTDQDHLRWLQEWSRRASRETHQREDHLT